MSSTTSNPDFDLLSHVTSVSIQRKPRTFKEMFGLPRFLVYKNGEKVASYKINLCSKDNKLGYKAVQNKDGWLLLDHPFYDLLQHPNERQDYFAFMRDLAAFLQVYDRFFVYMPRVNGKISQMVLTNPDSATIAGKTLRYWLPDERGNAVWYEVPLKDVHVYHNASPTRYQQAIRLIDQYLDKGLSDHNYVINSARTSLWGNFPGYEKEQLLHLASDFEARQAGFGNSGKPMFSNAEGATLTQPKTDGYKFGFPQEQMAELLAIFGVPDTLVFTSSSNLASAKEGTKLWLRTSVTNLVEQMESFFSQLSERLGYNPKTVWFEMITPDIDALIQSDNDERIVLLLQNGLVTIEEARIATVGKPFPAGHEIKEIDDDASNGIGEGRKLGSDKPGDVDDKATSVEQNK